MNTISIKIEVLLLSIILMQFSFKHWKVEGCNVGWMQQLQQQFSSWLILEKCLNSPEINTRISRLSCSKMSIKAALVFLTKTALFIWWGRKNFEIWTPLLVVCVSWRDFFRQWKQLLLPESSCRVLSQPPLLRYLCCGTRLLIWSLRSPLGRSERH